MRRRSYGSVLARGLALGLALALALPAVAAAEADRYVLVLDQEKANPAKTRALVESLGGTVVRDHSEIGVAIVSSEEPSFGRRLAQARGVHGVTAEARNQTNWSNELERLSSSLVVSGPPGGALAAPVRNVTGAGNGVIPDPRETVFWPFQWNLQVMGLGEVFEEEFYGIPQVEVAVLGAGIDYLHPDLEGKVDLGKSVSFVESDDILVQQLFPGAHPVADLGFHTTFVAGQIACNVTFLACTAPGVTLIGVKVLDKDEFGTIGDVVSGIVHSANVGADVIAIPFAMWGPSYPQWGEKIWNWGNPDDRADIRAMRRAILYAKLRGAAVIADASVPFFGFGIDADADGLDFILPAQAGATTIGCSGSEDTWCGISNYGFTLVDAVAPGGFVPPDGNIPNSEFVWGACSSFSQFGRLPDECAIENQPQFLVVLGPQVSVGHAAGVAALIDSRFGGHLPGFLVNAILLHTAVDIETPGRDRFTGHGRIDAARAVLP